jgi:hypothetical protein
MTFLRGAQSELVHIPLDEPDPAPLVHERREWPRRPRCACCADRDNYVQKYRSSILTVMG